MSSSQLAGMLIGYATETWVDEHYISIDFFSRLFQAHGTENGSEIDVMPNDMETTITSVESMFGFWTNLYISALGSNGAAPAGIALGMLTDVNISGTPSAGQVLTYDVATQKWVNGNGGASSIATLTDVTLTSPQTDQILIYDALTQKWVNSSVKTINGYSIFGTGDIPASGGGGGNYLPLAGGTMTGRIIFQNISGRSIRCLYNNSDMLELGDGGLGQGIIQVYNSGNELIRLLASSSYPSWIKTFLSIETGDTHNLTNDMLTSASFCIGEYDDDAMWMGRTPESYGWIQCSYKAASSAQYALLLNPLGGNVVIGKTTPSNFKLDVNGAISFNGGNSAGTLSFTNVSGRSVRCLRNGSDVVEFGEAGTGLGIVQVYDNGNEKIRLFSAGNSFINYGDFGIGTTSPSYRLHVAGDIYATGAITALSDARKKDIMGEAGVTVEQIAHAPAVQFLWKDKERRKDGQQVGTLAQYWQTVLPEVVMDKSGELSMQYGVAALVSSIIIARKVANHEVRIGKMEKWMKKWAEENDE